MNYKYDGVLTLDIYYNLIDKFNKERPARFVEYLNISIETAKKLVDSYPKGYFNIGINNGIF